LFSDYDIYLIFMTILEYSGDYCTTTFKFYNVVRLHISCWAYRALAYSLRSSFITCYAAIALHIFQETCDAVDG